MRAAWPLVPREPGESKGDFLGRLSELYVAAAALEQGIDTAAGLDRPVAAGRPYPVFSEDSAAAGELVEVLDHQMTLARD